MHNKQRLLALHPLALGVCLGLTSLTSVAAETPARIQVQASAIPEQPQQSRVDLQQTQAPSADLAESLRKVTGVSSVRMGGHGLDLVVRGQSQTRLNVLVDGAYVHGGCPNRMDPPTVYAPTTTYDAVTLIRGASSVQHGAGGGGATLLIERQRPDFSQVETSQVQGQLNLGHSSNANAYEMGAQVLAGNQSGYIRLFGEYKTADDYQDGDGQDIRAAYTSRNAGVALGFTPDEATWLELGYEVGRLRDALYAGSGMDSPYSDHDKVSLKFARQLAQQGWSQVAAELHASQVDHLMDNYSLRPVMPGAMKMRTPTESDTYTAKISMDYLWEASKLTIGTNWQQNQRQATAYGGMASMAGDPQSEKFYMWPEVTLNTLGVFAELMHPLNEVLAVKTGLRVDYHQAEADRLHAVPNGGTLSAAQVYQNTYGIQVDDEYTDTDWGGFARLEYLLNANALVYTSLSRSVRHADATERYFARTNWVGNPEIAPEKHHQLEVGIQNDQGMWGYNASLYSNWVQDYILLNKSTPVARYMNQDAHLYGAEFDVFARHGYRVASLGFAWTRAKLDDLNDNLPQIPPLEGRFRLGYESPKWSALTEVVFAAGQDKLSQVGGETYTSSGYGILNLLGHYQAGGVRWRAGVDNVFDRTYAHHINRYSTDPFAMQLNGQPIHEAGRSFWVGMDYQF
ncbi:iron complex outermembrane recepter protein [Allopseudospirillum japonicum]|uniref:Iron complex outermembrane recepter protein n=1 Tax=Allopseudospirillum japonicum TaxID=64971 RepID=A0A1H6QHQ1_9GAMM|nr:TonB-dependent copper receptor [Allopseudospirillum japonicum]SEI38765.1 iron complex outermembrane recepter protein [Allopseudospirillum japonicum]